MSAYSGPDDQEGMRKTDFCPNDQQPVHQTLSHDHQTKVRPLIPSCSCSGHCLTGNLTLQTTQIMCRQSPVRNRPVTPAHQSRSHGGWIYQRWLLNILNSDELMYVWDETHATNNFAIMTKLILQCMHGKEGRQFEKGLNNIVGMFRL